MLALNNKQIEKLKLTLTKKHLSKIVTTKFNTQFKIRGHNRF